MVTRLNEMDRAELADAVHTTVTRLSRELRLQARTPFTATQLSVLGSIHRSGTVRPGKRAAREHVSAPMISKAVAALEEHDVIERSNCRTDGSTG